MAAAAARCFSAPFGARAPKLRSRATMQKAQDVQHQTSDDATCTRHSHLGSACSCRFAHPFANGAQHRNRQLGVLHTFRPLDWPPLNDLLALASTCTHTHTNTHMSLSMGSRSGFRSSVWVRVFGCWSRIDTLNYSHNCKLNHLPA